MRNKVEEIPLEIEPEKAKERIKDALEIALFTRLHRSDDIALDEIFAALANAFAQFLILEKIDLVREKRNA